MTNPDSGVPRWVKLSILVGVLLAVVIVVLLLASGGHTPRPHG